MLTLRTQKKAETSGLRHGTVNRSKGQYAGGRHLSARRLVTIAMRRFNDGDMF